MKTSVSIVSAVILVSTASIVHAQNKIELYGDKARTTCVITETPPVTFVYAFVTGPMITGAVRFKAVKPDCWPAVWIGDNVDPLSVEIGDSQTDWSIAWGCPGRTPPALVGSILFIVTGTAQPCCEMVVTAPTPFPFEMADCDRIPPAEHPLSAGQKAIINPDATCPCTLPVSTESSTWGRVKSLYR